MRQRSMFYADTVIFQRVGAYPAAVAAHGWAGGVFCHAAPDAGARAPRQCGGHGSTGRPGVPLYGQPVVGGAERGTRIYPAAHGCPCRHADSVRLARQHAACRPQRHHNAGRSLSGGWPGTGSSAAGGYPWYRPATLPCGHAQLLCQLLGAGHHRAAGYGRVAGGYRPPPELCGRNRGCHCRNRSA